jgi:hypothetical protein
LSLLAQQFRKYTPFPDASGEKFTDPDPFVTTVPVKPAGAIVGVTIEPFVRPLISERLPRMERDSVVDAAGETDIEKDTDVPFQDAVSGTVWGVVPDAAAAKVALVAPAAITTVAGIDNTVFPPDRATVAPPAGADLERVTVQVAELPLDTFGGLQDRLVKREEATSETDVDWEMELAEAVITVD